MTTVVDAPNMTCLNDCINFPFPLTTLTACSMCAIRFIWYGLKKKYGKLGQEHPIHQRNDGAEVDANIYLLNDPQLMCLNKAEIRRLMQSSAKWCYSSGYDKRVLFVERLGNWCMSDV